MPYQGRQPGVGVRNRFIFIATSGQTSFSGADSNGLTLKYPDATYTDVFLNGVLLIPVTDYAATNNTSVVLSSGAGTSDVVEIVAYDISSIANTVPVSGGTFTGPVTVGGTLDVTGAFTSLGIDDNATSTAITIDASENVGIGVASPNAKLEVNGALSIGSSSDANTDIRLSNSTSTGGTTRIRSSGDDLSFFISNSQKMTIDASGNVGIGETNPDMKLHIKDASSAYVKLEDSGGVIGGAISAAVRLYAGADEHGQLGFAGTSSGIMLLRNQQGSLYLDADRNNAHTSSIMRFAVDNAERMRIDASGKVLIGATTSAYGSELVVSGGNDMVNIIASSTAAKTQIIFSNPNGNVGTIRTSGSSTAYNTSSDYRLKENVTPIQGAADIVKAMSPCTYTFKTDSTDWHDGFIAHELQEMHPRVVSGDKDAMRDEEYEVTPAVYEDVVTPAVEAVAATYDDEGIELTPAVEATPETTESVLVTEAVMGTRSVPDMQSVDYSKLTPILTAALQEALTEIAALKVRVAALEVTP